MCRISSPPPTIRAENNHHIVKVLAIDPGYDRLGVAVLERHGGKDVLLFSSCILTDKKASIPERLHAMGESLEQIIQDHAPNTLAMETLFFSKNAKTAIAVAESRGIVLYLARKAGCAIQEFSPQEVKVAATGYGKSDKQAVINMVKRLIPNVPEAALDDEYDAIAVGITALAHYRGD